jgi:hypothetical protein
MLGMNYSNAHSFIQTYSLKQSFAKFRIAGRKAAHKKMKQLHHWMVFKPIDINNLILLEKKWAMESLIFLSKKQNDTIEARACANRSMQLAYIPKEEVTSLTAATEPLLIIGVLDTKQKRNVMMQILLLVKVHCLQIL